MQWEAKKTGNKIERVSFLNSTFSDDFVINFKNYRHGAAFAGGGDNIKYTWKQLF